MSDIFKMLLEVLRVLFEGTKLILDSVHKLPLEKLECLSRIMMSALTFLLVLMLFVVLIVVLF